MAEEAKWYVIHTYSGYENKVASNLEKLVENRKMQDLIHEVRIPTETVVEVKDNKKREVERKIFPGYVMVKNDSDQRILVCGKEYSGLYRLCRSGVRSHSPHRRGGSETRR